MVALRLGDGRELGTEEAGTYDRILVDAPCSGLGALRRRPESRWNKSREDITDLVRLQSSLLQAAFSALRVGGVLVYSTCSPVIAETRDIITAFLEKNPTAELRDAAPIASDLAIHEVSSKDGMIQLWPDTDQTDAMFMALLTKTAE